MTCSRFVAGLASCAAGFVAGAASSEDLFHVTEIASQGRTLSAEIADLDGDGLQDLVQFTSNGLPPDEVRTIRGYLQTATGLPTVPSFEVPLPDGVAAYDLGDVLALPGVEVLLLRPNGLVVVSLAAMPGGEVHTAELPIPDAMSVGAGEDERGLDRIEIVRREFGPTPWLQVLGFSDVFFLAPDGRLHARMEVGGRANYFIQGAGPIFAESDIQLYFDAPRIAAGDVNGDGRADVVSGSRHEIRVFLRREDGGFDHAPTRVIPLRRVNENDHIRGSGSVRSIVRDIDGDGLLDLLISETRGGITDSSATSSVYLNRNGTWNLESPDASYATTDSVSTDQLVDLNGDGKLELVRYVVPINVLELVEVFVTSAVDANLSIYSFKVDPEPGASSGGDFESPAYRRKFDIPLDFETSRPKGFIPTLDFDFNADGVRDYLASSDGSQIEILTGEKSLAYARRPARQSVRSEGTVRGGDLDGDGLTDLLVFNTRRYNISVYTLMNLGALPGTPARAPEIAPANGAAQ